MIEQIAVVAGADEGDRVRLRAPDAQGCARCARGEGCGGGVFGKLLRRRSTGLEARDPGLALRVGEFVVIGIEEAQFLRAVALLYLTPLLGLFLGAGLGLRLGDSDLMSAAGGVAGLALALIWQRGRPGWGGAATILRRARAGEVQACQPVA